MGCLSPRRRASRRQLTARTLSRSASSATLAASTFGPEARDKKSNDLVSDADTSGTDVDTDSDNAAVVSTSCVEGGQQKQRRAAMAAVTRRIWAHYNSGAPLFTRDALRSLAQQLEQHDGRVRSGAQNAAVTVYGIDGRPVQLATQSGTVTASGVHPDIVLVNVKPQIDYWTIEKLTGRALWHVRRFDALAAYLALRIGHSQEARYRDAASGTVSTTGASTVAELARSLATIFSSQPLLALPELLAPRPRLAIDQVRSAFHQHRAVWEASEACRQLRTTLAASLAPQLIPHGRTVIRKIVAFACSSMTEEREGGSARHAVQHAMMMTVRDVLERMQNAGSESDLDQVDQAEKTDRVTVQCFAQDPAYDAVDRALLAEEGVAVLDDPHGFLAVDETSFVISVAPSVPVRQIVADIARPAAMIWGRVLSEKDADAVAAGARCSPLVEDMGGWLDPASSRVRQMIVSSYSEYDFPRDRRNFGTVDGVALYVRQPTASLVPVRTAANERGTWGAALLQRLQRALICQPGDEA